MSGRTIITIISHSFTFHHCYTPACFPHSYDILFSYIDATYTFRLINDLIAAHYSLLNTIIHTFVTANWLPCENELLIMIEKDHLKNH